ncbi:MAG: hypothetical protein M3Z16_03935 [Pseudomonadota bacterium]|nr:hypothetical protein [Pseudomonadota bacterium]
MGVIRSLPAGATLRRWPRGLAIAACATTLLLPLAARAATDAALLAAAHAEQPTVVDSLKAMVSIESGSADNSGLAKMAEYTEARLRALGAATERIAPTHGSAMLVKGVFSGNGSKRLMLIAQMDTVHASGILARDEYIEIDSIVPRLYLRARMLQTAARS